LAIFESQKMDVFEKFATKFTKEQIDEKVQELEQKIEQMTPQLKESKEEVNGRKNKKEDPVGYDYFCMPGQRILEREYYESQVDLILDRFVQGWPCPPIAVWKWEPTFSLPPDPTTSILSLIPFLSRPRSWLTDLIDPEVIELHKDDSETDDGMVTFDYIRFSLGSTFFQSRILTLAVKAQFHFQDPFDHFEEPTELFLTELGGGAEFRFTPDTSFSVRTTKFCNALHFYGWHRLHRWGDLELCGELEVPFKHGSMFWGAGARSQVAPGLFLQGSLKKNIARLGYDIYVKMDMALFGWCTFSLGLVNSISDVGLKVESPGIRLEVTF